MSIKGISAEDWSVVGAAEVNGNCFERDSDRINIAVLSKYLGVTLPERFSEAEVFRKLASYVGLPSRDRFARKCRN